jgi:hypothetical protein
MIVYATHRFSVGQQVMRSDEAFEVMAQIDGPNGPEYRLRSGTLETVASERELTYRTEPGGLGAARPSIVVH